MVSNTYQQFSDESIQEDYVYLANVELKVSIGSC